MKSNSSNPKDKIKVVTINGNLMPLKDAKVSITAPGLSYAALVFEGIREEKILGRKKQSAIDTGLKEALRGILDANINKVITANILCLLGASPSRG